MVSFRLIIKLNIFESIVQFVMVCILMVIMLMVRLTMLRILMVCFRMYISSYFTVINELTNITCNYGTV